MALTLTLSALTVPAAAHEPHQPERGWVDPTPGQLTWHDVARRHDLHGHHHGQPGHTVADYRREARVLNRYLVALARAEAADRMRRCARDVHCAIRLSAFLRRAPYGLMREIARCESGFNPNARNPTSSASGVFQWIRSSWISYSARAGHGGRSVFEVWANVDTAGHAIATGGPGPWAASRGCWS